MNIEPRSAGSPLRTNRASAGSRKARGRAANWLARALILAAAWACCAACTKSASQPADQRTAEGGALSGAGVTSLGGGGAGFGAAGASAGLDPGTDVSGAGGVLGAAGSLPVVPAAGSGANTGGNGANVAGGAAGAAGASAQAGTGALGAQAGNGGDVASIHYYGRWDRQPGKAIAVNGGSHVRAQFSGTGVSARFDISLNQAPNPTLVWRIDQGAWQEGELAASVVLATGLAAANHDLLLMIRGLNEYQNRWAPPLISAITFLGIDVTGGALTPSARAVGPRLEFLGDSITEGVAVWPNRTGKDTACWRADGRLGYAAQTSLTLGADWRQVGFGGEGVLKPGNGGVPVLNDSFNWIYAGVQRDAWQPDLAIINAGTVDRTDLGPNFGPAYTTYVSTVRAGYPGAKIVLLRPFGGYHAAEVKAEAAARNAAGDARIFYVDTTGWLSAPDYTDGIHPNVQGSAKVALALSAELKRIGLP